MTRHGGPSRNGKGLFVAKNEGGAHRDGWRREENEEFRGGFSRKWGKNEGKRMKNRGWKGENIGLLRGKVPRFCTQSAEVCAQEVRCF